LADGCSGHALAQAIDLGYIVVNGGIDGRVKLVVVDLATSGHGHIPFYLIWLGKFLAVKINRRL